MAFQILSFGAGCPSALVRCLKMLCSIHIYIPPSRKPDPDRQVRGGEGAVWGHPGRGRATPKGPL